MVPSQLELKQLDPDKPRKGSNEMYDEVLNPYNLVQQMEQIIASINNANMTTEVLGRTVSYNDIVLFKITELKRDETRYFRADESKYIDEVPEKKIVFIVHGMVVMGLGRTRCLHKLSYFKILLSYYLAHLDKFDIFLIPIANPDGYAYVMGRDIYWNKNMSPQSDCNGAMLDRNFDVAWNSSQGLGSCSQSYPGPAPFSEAETKAIRNVFHRHGHKIVAYINVHAGMYNPTEFKGEAILYPRGYTDVQSDDDKYIDLRGDVEEAMKNASFQVVTVTVETLHNWYGTVYGTSVDYASTVYGIPFALEFVMQVYQDYSIFEDRDSIEEDKYDYNALTQIWHRQIDVVFNYIWKSSQGNNDNMM
ncbi:carboxypeptidase B-like [Anticarsia gemmatalis]|uniref:carboxypeptidase B-like n=1 Tax=Anticarsia gemmatalis TaxID=129554 RepID=UPI003F76A4DC